MHDSAPIPPDPESERRGHELRDVAIKPILYFLIGLFVFGGVLQLVMSALMTGYVVPDTQVGVPNVETEDAREDQQKMLGMLRDPDDVVRNAPLQRNTTADMLKMYAEDDAVLSSFHLDKKTGKLQVPVKRAMEIALKKGLLPARKTPPKTGIDQELPYPMRSDPYKATP
jgi:hypothetical protein